jgi:geranylgeranyl diphosphate synthase type II
MQNNWKALAEKVEHAIQKNSIQGSPSELYEPIDYSLQMGGKRIRPTLVLLAAELFGKKADEVMHLALAVEVFHNFTLLHDDIMDEAPLRRGQDTVHLKWGRDIAILSGDVMMVKAYEFLAKSEADVLPQLLSLFNQTAIEVCEGQQLDMNFEREAVVSLFEYIRMIELKTAVLLAAALKMGAMASGASKLNADLIYEFGRNIGIAFQIQDDFLDAYSDPDKFGKQVGGDILQNKKTYLLLTALQEANNEQKSKLNELLLNNSKSEEKVEQMIALYDELNVPQLTQNAMQDYFEKGMVALEKIDIDAEAKKELIELAKMLMWREL